MKNRSALYALASLILLGASVAALATTGNQGLPEDPECPKNLVGLAHHGSPIRRLSLEKQFRATSERHPFLVEKEHRVSENGTTKAPGMDYFLELEDGAPVRIKLYGGAYHSAGVEVVDFQIERYRKGDLTDHPVLAKFVADQQVTPNVLFQVPLAHLKRFALEQFKENILNVTDYVLVPSSNPHFRSSVFFDLARVERVYREKMQVRLPNGEKKYYWVDDLFVWNGLEGLEEVEQYKDFVEMGGRGTVVKFEGFPILHHSHSGSSSHNGYLFLVNHLPEKPVGFLSAGPLDTLRELQVKGVTLLYDAAEDASHAAHPADGFIAGYLRSRMNRTKVGHFLTFSRWVNEYTLVHEGRHFADFSANTLKPLELLLDKLFERDIINTDEYRDIISFVMEERANAEEVAALRKDYSTRRTIRVDGANHEFRGWALDQIEFAMDDVATLAIPVKKILARLKEKHGLAAAIRRLMIANEVFSESLGFLNP